MPNPRGTVSNLIPFRSGQTGNPGGRAVGARNRLQGDFLNALSEHFAEHGKDAINRACKKSPLGYIKAVASLMPRQFENAEPFDGMDDEDIRTLLAVVRATRIARQKDSES